MLHTGFCHLKDDRRPEGLREDGERRVRQVPVICDLDILDVMPGGETWTDDIELVTCLDCKDRIDAADVATVAPPLTDAELLLQRIEREAEFGTHFTKDERAAYLIPVGIMSEITKLLRAPR